MRTARMRCTAGAPTPRPYIGRYDQCAPRRHPKGRRSHPRRRNGMSYQEYSDRAGMEGGAPGRFTRVRKFRRRTCKMQPRTPCAARCNAAALQLPTRSASSRSPSWARGQATEQQLESATATATSTWPRPEPRMPVCCNVKGSGSDGTCPRHSRLPATAGGWRLQN